MQRELTSSEHLSLYREIVLSERRIKIQQKYWLEVLCQQ